MVTVVSDFKNLHKMVPEETNRGNNCNMLENNNSSHSTNNNTNQSEMSESVVNELYDVCQVLSECCHVIQSADADAAELSQCLPFYQILLSDIGEMVSHTKAQQQQQQCHDEELTWDSAYDIPLTMDVPDDSASECSSLSSSMFKLSSADPRKLVGDLFVSSMSRFIESIAPSSVFNRRRAKRMRMKRKKSKVSKQFRTIWENAGAIFADKPVNAKVPMNEFTIDWTKVNSHFLRNIPSPKQVPVLGCSPDPMFYTDTVHVLEKGTRYEKTEVVKCSFNMDKFPHGYSWGFSTNKGIISAASVQVHGHIP